MTPAERALLADARRLLQVLRPLCQHLPPRFAASHLGPRCAELVRRIDAIIPPEAI